MCVLYKEVYNLWCNYITTLINDIWNVMETDCWINFCRKRSKLQKDF